MTIKEKDKQYVAGTYSRFDIEIVKGRGSLVYDSEDKEYIDLGTGIAVNAFGVCDIEWEKAVISQITKFQHTSNLYYSAPCAELAELLCKRTGAKRYSSAIRAPRQTSVPSKLQENGQRTEWVRMIIL